MLLFLFVKIINLLKLDGCVYFFILFDKHDRHLTNFDLIE